MENFIIENYHMDELDKKIISSLQSGVEITRHPYVKLAASLDISEEEICDRLARMHRVGFVRKNAIATNQYKLGYMFNAMTVWHVRNNEMELIGQKFSDLGFVSHCYERPKIPGVWDYNLFAMIHAKSEADLQEKITVLKNTVGDSALEMDVIISTEILKKTGIRLGDN